MRDKNDVWSAVEEFRAKHPNDLDQLPVDVLTVIEVQMRLDVIPFPGLLMKYSVDAAVVPNFSGIYVDADSYKYLEGRPPRQFNRMRFSLAHEPGHIVLHRELAKDCVFKSIEDFRKWTRIYNENRFTLEQQANEFGGRLIVPPDRLQADFDDFVNGVSGRFSSWWTSNHLRNAFCEQASEAYGVSADVIQVRLDREELWPSP